MWRKGGGLLAVSTIIALSPSCLMYTYVGGVSYFPEGADRSTHDRRLLIRVNGERGHAYVDQTEKSVFITWKKQDGTVLLRREYTVEAGDLEWATRRKGDEGFEAVFYEFVAGGATGGETARQVLAVSYARGQLTKAASGRVVPEWVLSHIESSLVR